MRPERRWVERLRETLRASRTSRTPIIRGGAGLLFAAREAFYSARKFLADGTHRSVALVRLLRPGAVHQTTPITWMDRYPELFRACRDYFGTREDLHLLSFGCSTGDEVVTLRAYFPTARITGAEINRRSLAACRSRIVDDRISFVYSTRGALRKQGPFDAIFCMAVLQRTPHTVADNRLTSLKDIYPFEKFEQQIAEFDAVLKPGGLLVVRHTQYRVRDTDAASSYTPLPVPDVPEEGTPLFDRRSTLIPGGVREGAIFVKQ